MCVCVCVYADAQIAAIAYAIYGHAANLKILFLQILRYPVHKLPQPFHHAKSFRIVVKLNMTRLYLLHVSGMAQINGCIFFPSRISYLAPSIHTNM